MKQFLLAIGIIGALFAFLQFSNPSLIGDDDVYWHLRYSENIFTTKPLTASFFGDPIPYAGVLFHLVLAPFTLLSNIFVAQKIAGIFLVCIIGGLVYLVLKTLKVRFPAVWTIGLFFISVNFSFRLLLVRTFLLSIILLLVAVYCILKKKYWLQFLVSVAYALSYSIPFLLALALLWVFAQVVTLPRQQVEWRVLLICLAGILSGIILHPVFPENVIFLKNYLLPVLYKVPVQQLGGGMELTPFSLLQFVKYEWMILAVWVVSFSVFIKQYYRTIERTHKLFFLLSASMFFVLALLSKRFIEYWTLFAGLAAFYIFKPIWLNFDFGKLKRQLVETWQLKVATGTLLIVLILGAFNNISTIHTWAKDGAKIDPYVNSGQWISVNISAGSTVLNSDWALYPKLYFYNSSVNYIAQFDPAYLYLKNRDWYNQWRRIADDRLDEWTTVQELHKVLSDNFQAQYLVIKTNQNVNLKAFLEQYDTQKEFFDTVYQDQILTVYKVSPGY